MGKTSLTFTEHCESALRGKGARLTAGRKAIIQAIAGAHAPLTAKEISECLKGRSVDKVSIYRTLAKLATMGLVHQVTPGAYLPCKHTRCGHEAHVLLRCPTCGRLEETELPQAVLSPLLWFLREKHQFQPNSHVFQVDGHCEGCRES